MPNSFLESVAGGAPKKQATGNSFLESATAEQHFYTPEVDTAVETIAPSAPMVPSESRSLLKRYDDWSMRTGKGIANFFYGGNKTEQELNTTNIATPLPEKTFFTAFKEIKNEPAKVLPFLQGGNEAAHAIELYNAGKRLENDTASARDVALMRDYIKRSQQDTSWGYDVANLVTQSIPFMVELGLTGGIYTAVRKGTTKGAEAVLKKFLTDEGKKLLEKRSAKFALKATTATVAATAQTVPAMFMNIGASTVEKMTPVYNFTEDEAGNVKTIIEKPGQDFGEALRKGLGESWVETVSERTGGVLGGLGGKVKDTAFKSAFVKAWFTGNVGVTASKKLQMLNKLMERVGWNGVVGEMFEERVGDVMHGILTEAGLSDQQFKVPTVEQLSTELVGFAVPGTVFAGAAGAINKGRKMKWEKDTEKTITESGLADDINQALTVHTEEDVKQSLADQTGLTSEQAQDIIDIAKGVQPTQQDGILDAEDVASEMEALAKSVQIEAELQAETSQALADQIDELSKELENATGKAKKDFQKQIDDIKTELRKRTDEIAKSVTEQKAPEKPKAPAKKGIPYKAPKFEKNARVKVTPKGGGEAVEVQIVGQREDGIIAKGQEGVPMLYSHDRFDVAPVEKSPEEKQIEKEVRAVAKSSQKTREEDGVTYYIAKDGREYMYPLGEADTYWNENLVDKYNKADEAGKKAIEEDFEKMFPEVKKHWEEKDAQKEEVKSQKETKKPAKKGKKIDAEAEKQKWIDGLTKEEKAILEKYRLYYKDIFDIRDQLAKENGDKSYVNRDEEEIAELAKREKLAPDVIDYLTRHLPYMARGFVGTQEDFLRRDTKELQDLLDFATGKTKLPGLYDQYEGPDDDSESLLSTKEGDIIIGRDGRMKIVTASNEDDLKEKDFTQAGYIRAKFVEDTGHGDTIEYPGRIRMATQEEIDQEGVDGKASKEVRVTVPQDEEDVQETKKTTKVKEEARNPKFEIGDKVNVAVFNGPQGDEYTKKVGLDPSMKGSTVLEMWWNGKENIYKLQPPKGGKKTYDLGELGLEKIGTDTQAEDEETEEDMPDSVEEKLAEYSDSDEMKQDWEDNYAEKVAELFDRGEELEKRAKNEKGDVKKATLKEIENVTKKKNRIENDFIEKYRQKATRDVKGIRNGRESTITAEEQNALMEDIKAGELSDRELFLKHNFVGLSQIAELRKLVEKDAETEEAPTKSVKKVDFLKGLGLNVVDATAKELTAKEMGANAFAKGTAMAPAQDPALMEMLKTANNKDRLQMLKDWNTGWTEQNLAAPVPRGDNFEQSIPKKVNKDSQDKFGKSFLDLTKTQRMDIVQGNEQFLVKSDNLETALDEFATATHGMNTKSVEMKSDFLYGGLREKVFTDTSMLISKEAPAMELLNSVLKKVETERVRISVKAGGTFAEAEKTAKKETEERIKDARFPDWKQLVPKKETIKPVTFAGIYFTKKLGPFAVFTSEFGITYFDQNLLAVMKKHLPKAELGITEKGIMTYSENGEVFGLVMKIKEAKETTAFMEKEIKKEAPVAPKEVFVNKTTDVLPAQKNKLAKSIMKIAEAHGLDLNGKEPSIRIENSPWMDLSIERQSNKVFISHVGEQNGDLMRDPEIMLEIVDGQMVPKTFSNDYAGISNSPMKPNEELVTMWAQNLLDQGFARGKIVTNGESSDGRPDTDSNGPSVVSEAGDVPTGTGGESGEGTYGLGTGELTDRVEKLGARPSDTIDVIEEKIGKKGRQSINDQVKSLLEAKSYSNNREDYTDDELGLLKLYSGAGGKESAGAEGKGLLSEFYTPNKVVQKTWELALQYAGDVETAFEPSAGTGRYIMLKPDGVSMDGIELDLVSGTVAQILNPDSNIEIGDFQSLFFQKDSWAEYDLVIGNPPYGARGGFIKGKGEESKIDRWEEYFIKRGLDMTKEGGIVAYVVNSSFLQKGGSKGKDAIAKLGKLEAAYRLPEGTFEDTTIGTDIVIFRKETLKGPSSAVEQIARDRSNLIEKDSYFESNKDNILGETKNRTNRFGKEETYVTGDLSALDSIKLDTTITPTEKKAPKADPKPAQVKTARAKNAKKGTKKNSLKQIYPGTKAKKTGTTVLSAGSKQFTAEELDLWKRTERDGSISGLITEPMKAQLNFAGGKWYSDITYYAGNISDRLAQLELDKVQMDENQYERQKNELLAVKPTELSIEDIIFDPLDRHVANIKLDENRTILRGFTNYVYNNNVPLPGGVYASDITRLVTGGNMRSDTKTLMPNIKDAAKRLFNHYIKEVVPENIQTQIVDNYNRTKNSVKNQKYADIPVVIEGMSKTFKNNEPLELSATQKRGVSFLVQKGAGLLAWGVGVGKTLGIATATVGNMQAGRCKRPLIAVPKATIDQTWVDTFQRAFPGITLVNLSGLTADVVRKLRAERGEPKDWIKDGEIAIISHQGLMRLGFNEEELRSLVGDLNDALWSEQKTKRGAEGEKAKIDEIAGQAQRFAKDILMSDLGIDHISVDEVHNHRKVFQGAKASKEDGAYGQEQGGKKRFASVIGGTPSARAVHLFLTTQYIQKKFGGNVFLASATPFENHATEVYNILSFVARDRMKQMGIFNINDFFAAFADFVPEVEIDMRGKAVTKEKMKNFKNLPALQSLLREYVDRKEDPTLIRPERRVMTPILGMSALQEENLAKIQLLLAGLDVPGEELADILGEDAVTLSSKDKEEGAFLVASQFSIANSVSPYFIERWTNQNFTPEELVENSPKIKYAMELIKKLRQDPKTKDYGTFLYFGKHGKNHHQKVKDYIVNHLGFAENEVQYINGDIEDDERETIKDNFNTGEVKVLIGGDPTKEGIDLQNNGYVTINLALGWNPTEPAQVEGRVWRQGNKRSIAPLVYPLVENSGDVMIYNKFEEKGGRINDLFSYQGEVFDVSEIDPQQKKIALLTNPEAKATMEIEYDRARLDNERIGILTEQKNLQTLHEDLEQSENMVLRMERYIKEEPEDSRVADWRKERDKYKAKVKRIQESFAKKNVVNVVSSIETLKKRVTEIEETMKTLSDTYKERLARFSAERAEEIRNRKTVENHVEDFFTATADLKERTEAEIKAMRQEKIREARKNGDNVDFKRKFTRDEIGRFSGEPVELLTPKEVEKLNPSQRENYDKFVVPQLANIPYPQEGERIIFFSGHNGAPEQYVDTDLPRALDRGNVDSIKIVTVPTSMLKSTGFADKDKMGERKLVSQVSFKLKDPLTTKILNQVKEKKTVSKQFIVDATKQQGISGAERELILRVLEDENDTVQVDKFIERVEMELLPLEPQEASGGAETRYENTVLDDKDRGPVADYQELIYESPIQNPFGDIHWSEVLPNSESGYFAHVRAEDLAEESSKPIMPGELEGMTPREAGKYVLEHNFGVIKTRRIIEVQSDLFQKGKADDLILQQAMEEFEITAEEAQKAYKKGYNVYRLGFNPMSGEYDRFEKVEKWEDEEIEHGDLDQNTEYYAYSIPANEEKVRKTISKLLVYRNTWQDRIIREEIRRAALDGITRLQFPTGDTAMMIEGLGQPSRWYHVDDRGYSGSEVAGTHMLKVGSVVKQSVGNVIEGGGTWVVTDILDGGTFKAVSKRNMDMLEAGAKPGEFLKETFDVSGTVDKKNPIYVFYEKEVAKYLKNKYGIVHVTDAQGVTWNEVKITKEMAGPVEAFSTLDEVEAWLDKKVSGQLIGRQQTIDVLQEFKDRLKVDFNVHFFDKILTGEVTPAVFSLGDKKASPEAWGVTVSGAMAFTEKTPVAVPAHEVVHFVMNNLDKLPEFGVTKAELNALASDEAIAVGFETYWKTGKAGGLATKVVEFLKKLATMIREILGIEVTQAQALQKFYYDVMYMRRFGPTVSQRAKNLKPLTYVQNGEIVLDFEDFEALAESHYKRKTVPEDLVKNEDVFKTDLTRKDINLLNDITAQARDIYLKNPKEFRGADIFQTVADTRRIKKGSIDRRFADMLKPYFDLQKDEKATLNIALVEGDRQTRKWNKVELATFGVTSAPAISAYYKTREAFEYAHDLLLAKMEDNGVKESEIELFRALRVGYVPHKWAGRYVIKTQVIGEDGQWKTESMQDFKTERQARSEYEKMSSDANVRYVLDTLDSVDVDFFTAQHLTAENVISAINRSKVPEEFRQEVVQGIRNLAKEKGFGRYYIRRTNIDGYETENMDKIFADYFSGLAGYITKMEAAPMYFKALQTVDPRRQSKFYRWLRDSIAYDMGSTAELNGIKQAAFIWMLANDISYLIVNATQNFTVGMGELSKYMTGAKKIAGAETALMGAMVSWWTGNITAEERKAVEYLLKNGRLGGEMTSELMGFKSNPIYRTISNTLTKALYSTTAFVESNINRVPAFIAARRTLLANGADPATVDKKALSISDDIHFRYGKQNRPRMERGRAGALFVFTHWTRSFLYQLSRDLSKREFMALGKKMFYTTLLGGVIALPFAKIWLRIYREIFGDDDDPEVEKELSTWELAIKKGLPAVIGMDLSGRVSIDIMQFDTVLKDPTNVVKWAGAAGGLLDRFYRGYGLAMQERYFEAASKLVPDGLGGNFFKAYSGYSYGVRSQAGKLLERSPGVPMKYTPWEAALRGLGFTPTQENLAWERRGKVLDKEAQKGEDSSIVRRKIETRILQGDLQGARELEAQAKADDKIGETSTPVEDYIEKPALMKYTARAHAGENLALMKKLFIAEVYPGEKLSDQKKAALDKKFDSYAVFGPDNATVTALLGGKTNENRVKVLLETRQTMGAEAFAVFFSKARRTKLISDELAKLYRREQAKVLNP